MRHKSIHYRSLSYFYTPYMRMMYACGISCRFQQLSPCRGQVTYVLLTRSPLPAEAGRSTCMY